MGNNFPCGVRNCCSLLLTLRCSQLLFSATDLAVFAHCYLPHRLSHHTLLKLLALQRSFYLLELLALQRSFHLLELLALQRSFFQLSHQLLLVLPTFASTATSLSTFASSATSLLTFASSSSSSFLFCINFYYFFLLFLQLLLFFYFSFHLHLYF